MPHNGKKTKNEERKIAIIAFTADGVDDEGLRYNGSKKGLSPFFLQYLLMYVKRTFCMKILKWYTYKAREGTCSTLFHTGFPLGSYLVPTRFLAHMVAT